jgi:hypothetical protein
MSDIRLRNHRATCIQREWERSNLAFLYVEPVRREFCRRCGNSDPLDPVEDFIIRWGVMRRRHPMLSPDQIKRIVRAGIEAERIALLELGGRVSGR